MRSILDPLPRFLTTRSLVLVVGMLVFGTAISVHEYLESARPPAHASARPADAPVVDLGRDADRNMGAPRSLGGTFETRRPMRSLEIPRPRGQTSTSSSSSTEPAPGVAAPSIWEPAEPPPGR